MKTTVELDDRKIKRVMSLVGLKTRKATIDFALDEVERLVKMEKLFSRKWSAKDIKKTVAPRYNILKLREMELKE